jgi:DNA-binding transcriptional regulator YhcF (GntR family)
MFGIESQINNYDSIIKEKDILFNKFQFMFDEARKDLLTKYREIDNLKDNFMKNMGNTEDTVKRYLNKKDQITFEQIKNSIKITKKIEKEYKKSINTAKSYEDNFCSMYENSIVNIKKLTSETSGKMKDIIIDFLILLKNNFKMQLSEIDIYLPELNELNEVKTLENLIESSFSSKNKLGNVKPYKYKLKIFQNINNKNNEILNNNSILNLEDGFEEMPTIKDEIILFIFKTMKENFELIEDNNINLKTEEEKMKCLILTEKILSLEEKKSNKNNEPTKKDIDELNSLLDIHSNRVVFLQKLSEYRIKGKFELTKKTFDIFTKLFNTIINTTERDNDFHSIKNAIILSQTYYIKTDNNNKLYLQKNIENNKIFKSKSFWEEFLQYSISKEIVVSINNDTKNGTLLTENKKDSDDKKSNIAFSQILPYADNMREFGLDKETIQEIIYPIINQYKINPESIEVIKSLFK